MNIDEYKREIADLQLQLANIQVDLLQLMQSNLPGDSYLKGINVQEKINVILNQMRLANDKLQKSNTVQLNG